MRMLLFRILGLVLIFFQFTLYADDNVEISEINASENFPEVSVKVNIRTSTILKNGLNEDNISVFENGYKVNYIKVTGKGSEKVETIYFVLSVDSSKSISEKYLSEIKKSIAEILSGSSNTDKIAVFRFNDKVILLNDFTSDKTTIIKNVEEIEREGTKTVLYDSVYDSITLLNSTPAGGKSVIIFTDGKDEGSSVTVDDVINFAKSSNIPLHFMCMNSSSNISKMQRMARLTGGKMILGENISEIPQMYNSLLGDINSEYVIKYTSQLRRASGRYPLKINVKMNGLEFSDVSEIESPSFLFLATKPDLIMIFLALIFILVFIIMLLLIRIVRLKKRNFVDAISVSENQKNNVTTRVNTEPNAFDDQYLKDLVERGNWEIQEVLNERRSTFSAWLIQKNGFELGEKFPIYWKEITIGSSKENAIVVNDERVADRHVRIREYNDRYILMDLATDSGTFLNGNKLLRPKELFDWDEIKIGNTLFLFRGV